MKRLRRILILFIEIYILIFFILWQSQALPLTPISNQQEVKTNPQDAQDINEDDLLLSEPEIFFRKYLQRKLPSLTPSQIITWSFRMADKNALL